MDQTISKNIKKDNFQPFRNDLEKTDFDKSVEIENPSLIRAKVLKYSSRFSNAGILNNSYKNPHNQTDIKAC